ncbi:hypothetical protein BDN72DRAFT_406905 [Pluteus cervinus]|uniref:Uncharacterized protein n=1 Tax=Pluteus cervinus TaxID=181527 RepID=A0ACD3A889_9AGAR|nr:hypothetical protein BDN72DRAFT_406905 [Pluteus cervinus]
MYRTHSQVIAMPRLFERYTTVPRLSFSAPFTLRDCDFRFPCIRRPLSLWVGDCTPPDRRTLPSWPYHDILPNHESLFVFFGLSPQSSQLNWNDMP